MPEKTFTAYYIPLSVLTQWPRPNYVNPETRRWIIPLAIFLQFLSTVCICGRMYARSTRRKFGLDDVLIILAWMLGTLFLAVTTYGVINAGFDRHTWDVPPASAVKGGFVAWISEAIFLLSTTTTKLSVLVFQRRLINPTVSPRIRQVIDIAIAFTIVYTITFMLLLLLACTPIDAAWKTLDIQYNQPYRCIRYRNILDPLASALSVFSDVYALVIPEIVFSKLRIQRTQKVILYAVFGSGLIVAGAGLGRTIWFTRMYTDSMRDFNWIGYEVLAWSELECQLAIVCASAPALRSLLNAKSSASAYGKREEVNANIDEPVKFERRKSSFFDWKARSTGPGDILVTETLSIQSAQYREASSEKVDKGRKVLGLLN